MDVLAMIDNLKQRLFSKYGDVLKTDYTQDEIHMTYYISDLLEKHGLGYHRVNDQTMYTEKALNAAFIAGMRIGNKDAEKMADAIVQERLSNAINALMEIK